MIKQILLLPIIIGITFFVNSIIVIEDKDTIIADKELTITEQQLNISSVIEENGKLKNKLLDILSKGIKVTVTNYNPVKNQTDNTPNILADLSEIQTEKASRYQYVAVSRNLHERWGGFLKFGDLILLKNAEGKDGIYIVKDVMNQRFVNAIDILETYGINNYKYVNVDLYKLSWIVDS